MLERPSLKVGRHSIAHGHPTYFVAEIGNNHNGDAYLAKRLIEESVAAGADAVKLQKRSVADVFTTELRNTPQTKDVVYGKTYGEYREQLELTLEEFRMLKEHAETLGATLFATPFDHKSVGFLEDVGVDVYKIASFDITNLPLIADVASKNKPIFVSTGMCTWEELDEAVTILRKSSAHFALLHCVSSYPTPDEELNLGMIEEIRRRYKDVPVGYSGHENDILASLTSVCLGACIVERHITLDRHMPGPDHATVSIEPDEFKKMVDETRRIEQSLGNGDKRVLASELTSRLKHTKSITTAQHVASGTTLTADMLVCKSPGRGLRPRDLPKVIGRRVRHDIPADRTVTEDDLEPTG